MTAFPEAPFGTSDRIELSATPLAVIRHSGIRLPDLRTVFDGGFAAFGKAVADGALQPAGPALAVFLGDPMDVFDLEIGFPVDEGPASPIALGDGREIVASELPAGPAYAASVFGTYDGLGEAWGRLVHDVAREGAESRGVSIEVYVSDPSVEPSELRTDIILPVTA